MKILIFIFSILLITGCKEDTRVLSNNPETVSALTSLMDKKKFTADMTSFYLGAPDEATRDKAQKIIDHALATLISISKIGVSEEGFWLILESAARQLKEMDSEEMDRGLTYMEEIMDIYELESSDGRLNEWRYGFDPDNPQ